MPTRRPLAVVLLAPLALCACGGPPAPLTADSPEIRTRLADAQAATDDFRARLGRALTAAIQRGGFADAISVCATTAPEIAASYTRPDRRVYRVGTRARNARLGTPDEVERRLLARLEQQPHEPVWELERDARGKAVGLRYLRPIRIGADRCLKCHGGPDDLAPGVPDALKARYPDDRATGYRLGDLRGAFVVRYRL